MAAKYKKSGGSVFDQDIDNTAGGKSAIYGGRSARANAKEEVKSIGKTGTDRLDKKARGGFMGMPKRKGFRNPKGPKLAHTININMAPQAAPSDGAEPMVPNAPMGPPPGGLMGGGEPGLPGAGGGSKLPIPGMVKRGGKATRG